MRIFALLFILNLVFLAPGEATFATERPCEDALNQAQQSLSDTQQRFQSYLNEIQLDGWNFYLGLDDSRLYLQARFQDYDSYTSKNLEERSGKRYLSSFMTKNEVIQQALALSLSATEHQVRKNFFYKEKRIFGPRFNIDMLSQAAHPNTGVTAAQPTAKYEFSKWISNISTLYVELSHSRVSGTTEGFLVDIKTSSGQTYSSLFIRHEATEIQAVSLIFDAVLSALQKNMRLKFLVNGKPIFLVEAFQIENLSALCTDPKCLDQRPH